MHSRHSPGLYTSTTLAGCPRVMLCSTVLLPNELVRPTTTTTSSTSTSIAWVCIYKYLQSTKTTHGHVCSRHAIGAYTPWCIALIDRHHVLGNEPLDHITTSPAATPGGHMLTDRQAQDSAAGVSQASCLRVTPEKGVPLGFEVQIGAKP